MRKYIILLSALFFLVMGSGCMTALLYSKNKPKETITTTQEEVSSFLITEDGKQLIVVGKRYHYIFEPNDTLKFILNWPDRKLIAASFTTFDVDTQQNILGRYFLTVDPNAVSEQAREKLLANGFLPNNDKPIRLSYDGVLTGKRYSSNNFTLPKSLQFSQKYTIAIRETSSSGASTTVANILLTPLSLAADGVLFCAGVPVALFIAPFFYHP